MFSRFIVITMLVVPMLFALAEPIPTLTPSPTSAPEGKRGLLDNIGNALTSIGAEIGDEITEHAGNIIDQITAAGAFQTLVSGKYLYRPACRLGTANLFNTSRVLYA